MSVTPVVSSEQGPHTLDSARDLGESSFEEPLRKNTEGDSVLKHHVPEVKEQIIRRGTRGFSHLKN